MSPTNRDSLTLFAVCVPFISFLALLCYLGPPVQCWIEMMRVDILALFLILVTKCLSFYHYMEYEILGVLWILLVGLGEFFEFLSWKFCHVFSLISMIMWLFIYVVNMVSYIYWSLNVKSPCIPEISFTWSWWIIFYIVLHLLIFFQQFGICVHEGCGSIISFLSSSPSPPPFLFLGSAPSSPY